VLAAGNARVGSRLAFPAADARHMSNGGARV
jgi:hypothetical protein